MPDENSIDISERAETVLRGLISRYIEDGTPVGSRTLSKEPGLALSPATIRNVMADLEECGLIEAPHTSAGRVPTQAGYRLFINKMLRVEPVKKRSIDLLEHRLSSSVDEKALLTSASEMLSQMTSFAGIVSVPSKKHVHIRQIEFLKISQQRVIAILITDDGQVQNKLLNTHREYGDSELVEAANFFNAEYAAKTLEGVKADLLKHLQSDHQSMHREMRTAIKIAGSLFDDDNDGEAVLVSGENNLLSIPDFAELEKLKQLFDTFKTKQVLFDLLQKSLATGGVNIFIGEESGYKPFRECSVISAPYEIDSERVGVLGIIGPTRMNYDEVVSTVDITAKLLGSALTANSQNL
ncbi:MAG: heat-inducible transcriptional repressor HrcA [Pseudomonadota bacterium]